MLVFKAKAAWDRNYDVITGTGDDLKKDKVKKDRYDIVALLRVCEYRQEVLNEIVLKNGFEECFVSAVSEALEDKDVSIRHALDRSEKKTLDEKVDRIIKKME